MASSYSLLSDHFARLHKFHHVAAICAWDQAAMMPAGSHQARAEAMAELSKVIHQQLTDPRLEDWIQQAQEQALDADQAANLRLIKRQWQQAQLLPEALVEAQSRAKSRCEHAWRQQRPENDWTGFAVNFSEVLTLSREEAAIRAEAGRCSRYDSLLDLFEPGMTSGTLDRLFDDLKGWLPALIQRVAEQQSALSIQLPQGPFSTAQQKALGLKMMEKLGFDFSRGRLDVSTHPFCGGVPEDVRITTRYDQRDFSSALMGVIHETGHARYEQNLPAAWIGQPAGQARSVGIHESQSLFFEMQLARSTAFLELIRPELLRQFERDADPAFALGNLVALYRRVQPGYIRVEADEVTYPAHVILRYELERDLIEARIEVADIPELWNDKMQQYLGLSTADNFTNGCLQDIHWAIGTFGYFPSYTLGAMYAAQQAAAIERQLGPMAELIRNDQLTPIFDWLKANIWQRASLLDTDQLLINATGEPLNPEYFRRHLERRYGSVSA